jgi:hypothetical protein
MLLLPPRVGLLLCHCSDNLHYTTLSPHCLSGEYASVAAQRDAEAADIEKERLMQQTPEHRFDEVMSSRAAELTLWIM